MKERHLSEASVREHAGEILKRAEREWKLRHMGCLTDEEWYRRTEKVLIYDGVTEFLAGKKSVTSISQPSPVFLASLLFELISAFLLQLGGA